MHYRKLERDPVNWSRFAGFAVGNNDPWLVLLPPTGTLSCAPLLAMRSQPGQAGICASPSGHARGVDMGRKSSQEEIARVNVIATVLECVCEALSDEAAARVCASIRRAFNASPSSSGDKEDAAQAQALAPLLAALRR